MDDPFLLMPTWYPANSVHLKAPAVGGSSEKMRATGKSQWEIPTEPVVLTPSTTPTSIGTGPTYPPSRPSTNSPQVAGPGSTLEGRFEPVGINARAPRIADDGIELP
ncbi:hypothetical protein VI817_002319 [Penicillium citrinum]|nr:hypothetical protein VI817_002319 [Penicillium citrinum]